MRFANLSDPVDNGSLVAVRIAFGLYWCIRASWYLLVGYAEIFETTSIVFHPWGWQWLALPQGITVTHLFAILALTSAAIAAGVFTRAAAATFALALVVFQFQDETTWSNLNYLSIWLALALVLAPGQGQLALDLKWKRRPPSDVAPLWQLLLIRFHVVVLYFYAGIAKLHPEWILDGQPLGLWLGENLAQGPFAAMVALAVPMSVAGLLVDLGVGPMLCWRRTRTFALIVIISFHSLNFLLVIPGTLLPLMLLTLTVLAFLEPAKISGALATVRQRLGRPPLLRDQATVRALSKPLAALLALYMAFHLLFPLRHYVYAGKARWNYHGQLYSWWLRTNYPDIKARFEVRVDGGPRAKIPVLDFIHPAQSNFVIDPYNCVRFAKHLAAQHRAKGARRVEVYAADVNSSLNGLPRQPFLRDDVDLSRESLAWDMTHLVVPLRARPPHRAQRPSASWPVEVDRTYR